ncbi:hypothetical protein ACPCG0_06310 [Propionibacteriaceae bacterium Y1923]
MHAQRRPRPILTVLALFVSLVGSLTLTAVPARAALETISLLIFNRTDQTIHMNAQVLGCFTDGGAGPHTVEPDHAIHFSTQDCDLSLDTQLRVNFRMETTGTTGTLFYSNPLVGADTFSETPPAGYVAQASGVIEDRRVNLACDSACDGIPRAWKENGVTIDPGGGLAPQFINLPAMGVTLDRPNVLVHMDRMVDTDPASPRDQSLRQAAIDDVIRAFDQAPRTYRGASRPGITLIVDAGPDSTITPGGATWGGLSRSQQVPYSRYLLTMNAAGDYIVTNALTLVRNEFVPTGRLPIFHYAIAGAYLARDVTTDPDSDDTTSGLALGTKLAFMVTLGSGPGGVGSQAQQTGTFMHELGHILGLDHGGEDEVNHKPNYPSVMNYAWQMTGVLRNGSPAWDYSRDTTLTLSEAGLTEATGINLGTNASGSGTSYRCRDTTYQQAALRPVDFSCNFNTSDGGTGFDVNGDGEQGLLTGSSSDWSRINFLTGGLGRGAIAKDLVTIPGSGIEPGGHELTVTDSLKILTLPLETTLTYTGVTSTDYHDEATMTATLTRGTEPVADRDVVFRIGGVTADSCTGTTDPSGVATCTITISQAPKSTTVTADWAGDDLLKQSSDSATFTVTREQTATSLTTPTAILAGQGAVTLSATLLEDGVVPTVPSGQQVVFTLGAQTCTGTVASSGAVSCTLTSVPASSLGPTTLRAAFAGDTYYEPSEASAEVIVFAFPADGAFVVSASALEATPNNLTWWSSSWTTANQQSGGNSSFKGFVPTVNTLPTTTPVTSCGTTFTGAPGNSGQPPSQVPSYMGGPGGRHVGLQGLDHHWDLQLDHRGPHR